MDLELKTWLKDGKYRISILKILKSNPLLPSEIAIELNLNRASISRILRQLKEKELIKSTSAGGRTVSYQLTNLGSKAIINEVTQNG